jgi:hypothetical protein
MAEGEDNPYDFVFRRVLIEMAAEKADPQSGRVSRHLRTECCDAPVYLAESILLTKTTTVRCLGCRQPVGDRDDAPRMMAKRFVMVTGV